MATSNSAAARRRPVAAPLDELAVVAAARAHAAAVCAALDRRYESDPRFRFDELAAGKACAFFPKFLRHSRGPLAGRAFELEDWQRRIVRLVFGWKHRDTGLRVIRRVYLFVARKNGKSTFCAGLALLMLLADGEQGAEVYSAAADKGQAGIVFNEAARMTAASKGLSDVTETFKNAIVCTKLSGTYQVLSADAENKHGLNPSAILFDELHTQPSRDLLDVLHTAVGARRQPLEVLITTAGYDRHSICWEVHRYALQVLDGTVDDPAFLPVLFMADEKDDWTDPLAWAKANPSLGVAVQFDYLVAECRLAQETPGYQNTFRRLHLNQWTEQTSRAIDMGDWDACAGDIPWQEMEERMRGRRCSIGLDLSTTTDLTAQAHVFPPEDGEEFWHIAWRFFVPEDNMRRRAERDGVPYPQWHREGALVATPGNVVDYRFVGESVMQTVGLFQVADVGYDPWNATALATDLQDEGVPVVEVRQGIQSLGEATKFLLGLVASGRLAHGGHPIARWMAANLALKADSNGNVKPDKSASGERIDGLVAAVIGLARALVHGEISLSVYSTMSDETAAELGIGERNLPNGSQRGADQAQTGDIDRAILADPRHPRFEEMRQRYNEQLALADGDEDY